MIGKKHINSLFIVIGVAFGSLSLNLDVVHLKLESGAPRTISRGLDTYSKELFAASTPTPLHTPISTAPSSPTPIPTEPPSAAKKKIGVETPFVINSSGVLWYVANGGDDFNDCLSSSYPCQTINGAIGKASSGDTVNVAEGTYTDTGSAVVLLDKSLTLLGGWETSFTTQSSTSVIDGQNSRRALRVYSGVVASLDRFLYQNGMVSGSTVEGGGIYNEGTLTLHNCAITNNTLEGNTTKGGGIYNKGPAEITIETCDINNNVSNDLTDSGRGGGIYNASNGTIEINNSSISDNLSGYDGGGIYNESGEITISNSQINSNTTHFAGGGIHNFGTMDLDNCTLNNNESASSSAGDGGGIYNNGQMTLSNCSINGNSAGWKGGGILNGGDLMISDSRIENNLAKNGGGIRNTGTLNIDDSVVNFNDSGGITNVSPGVTNLINSTVSYNTKTMESGYNGGGIFNSGTFILRNSTVSGNTAYDGGGISNTSSSSILTINNSTITGNLAHTRFGSGGLYLDDGTLTLSNTIIAGNTGFPTDCKGTIISSGYNLIGDASYCSFSSTTGDITDVEPLLGPLQDNGGLTDTHALLSGSPAIDAGNPVTPGSGGNACEATDQRGLARPFDGDLDGGEECDIGSYEAPKGTTLLMDGGFELGSPNPVWAEYSTNFGTPLCTVAECGEGGGTGPHLGNWWSWFGGVFGVVEEGYVSQSVDLPPGSKSLSFWLEIPTPSGGGNDYLNVNLDGYTVFSVTGAYAASYFPYTQVILDVSAYCGTSNLQMYSKTYGSTITNFFIDDVALELIEGTVFCDVLPDYWARQWIEALYDSGITSGCSVTPPLYCPDSSVTRAQMAVFLERGMRGSGYSPPPASGTVFDDVPASHWAAAWIEQLAADGITGGCSTDPPLYCPESSVTRAQMAIFLERAMHWPTPYSPPPASGTVFDDVPVTHWAAAWIEQLAADGITGGCSASPPMYCPENPVTRAQMAVFLVRTFNLPMP